MSEYRTVEERAECALQNMDCRGLSVRKHPAGIIAEIKREFADVVDADPRVIALVEAANVALPYLAECLSLLRRYADKVNGSEADVMRAVIPTTIRQVDAALQPFET